MRHAGKMRWIAPFLILAGSLCLAADQPEAATPRQDADADVVRIRLEDEPITPVTAKYIARGLREAAETGAACLILELDTPGGLMASTKTIVSGILSSPVPVVVYVAPHGARAASAGVFITLAAHVAAMAPATHIGAAHPVSIGGAPAPVSADTSGGQGGVMEEKVVNDAMAWARSLAELRGRNAAWAARAVSESESLTGTEALDEGVVDLVADDLDELLARIDGRGVEVNGETTRLQTAGAEVRTVGMWWGERLLGVLSNPNVAFLLLMLGFYGILFELYTPGWGVSGTLGAISLMLAFFGLAVLPVNLAGLALMALGLGLFVAEAFVPSFGALTLGGAVCLALGGLMLIDSPVGFMRVSAAVVIPVALATAVIAFFLVGQVVKTFRSPVHTGSEGMVGTTAVALDTFVEEAGRYRGMVRMHGELWQARSTIPVEAGQPVVIRERDGLMLIVDLSAGGVAGSGS